MRFSNAPKPAAFAGVRSPITAVKNFEHRIDPAFFYLISIAFVARLNQICNDAQALADDSLSF